MPSAFRLAAVAGAFFVVLGAAPTAGFADDPDPKEIVTKADADLKAGDPRAAIEGYERAQKIKPASGLFFNLGNAFKQAGEPEKALDAFRTYLKRMPNGAKRAEAQKAIETIEAEMEAAKKAAAEKAAVEKAAAEKYAVERAAAERATAEEKAAAERAAAAAPVAAPAPSKNELRFEDLPKKWWFWTAAGVVAAGVITGIVVAATAKHGPDFPETGPGAAAALVQF